MVKNQSFIYKPMNNKLWFTTDKKGKGGRGVPLKKEDLEIY